MGEGHRALLADPPIGAEQGRGVAFTVRIFRVWSIRTSLVPSSPCAHVTRRRLTSTMVAIYTIREYRKFAGRTQCAGRRLQRCMAQRHLMSIGRILAIRVQPSAPPQVRSAQAAYEALIKTSVGKVVSSHRSDHKSPMVFRHGQFIRAYPGMPLQIRDCVGGSVHFVITIQCGSVTRDLGGGYWAQMRGAEDIAVSDSFPIVPGGLTHGGPQVFEASSGARSFAVSVNPPSPAR